MSLSILPRTGIRVPFRYLLAIWRSTFFQRPLIICITSSTLNNYHIIPNKLQNNKCNKKGVHHIRDWIQWTPLVCRVDVSWLSVENALTFSPQHFENFERDRCVTIAHHVAAHPTRSWEYNRKFLIAQDCYTFDMRCKLSLRFGWRQDYHMLPST